jgi:predicted site-specific integrase-resolvase
MDHKPQLLDTENAAKFLGLSHKTLEAWRYADRIELPYVRLGRRIFYEVPDLLAFVQDGKVHGHSQEAP